MVLASPEVRHLRLRVGIDEGIALARELRLPDFMQQAFGVGDPRRNPSLSPSLRKFDEHRIRRCDEFHRRRYTETAIPSGPTYTVLS